jgi:hypothetical protein
MDRSPRAAQLTLDALIDRAQASAIDAARGARDPEQARLALEARIIHSARQEVRLRLTDNSHTMLSTRFHNGVRSLRLHRMFVDAPQDVIDAVGSYIARGDAAAGRAIDQFIEQRQHTIAARPRRSPPLRARGSVHDLADIQRALSQRYFDASVSLPIGWGRSGTARGRRGRRTIRMGVYLLESRSIRIHPALDQAWVPRFFVEWVVFHEMLHHVVPAPERDGRRDFHSAIFRERERAFADFDRAQQWERDNLARLIATRTRDRRAQHQR